MPKLANGEIQQTVMWSKWLQLCFFLDSTSRPIPRCNPSGSCFNVAILSVTHALLVTDTPSVCHFPGLMKSYALPKLSETLFKTCQLRDFAHYHHHTALLLTGMKIIVHESHCQQHADLKQTQQLLPGFISRHISHTEASIPFLMVSLNCSILKFYSFVFERSSCS